MTAQRLAHSHGALHGMASDSAAEAAATSSSSTSSSQQLATKRYFLINAPELIVDGAAAAIDFYKAAFGAVERERYHDSTGLKVAFSNLLIGEGIVYCSDPFSESGWPATRSSTRLFVADTDAVFQRAVGAGATAVTQPATMDWGDRMARVMDPFGQHWTLTTHEKEEH